MEPSRDIRERRQAEAEVNDSARVRPGNDSVGPPSQVNYRANRQYAREYWLPGNQDRQHVAWVYIIFSIQTFLKNRFSMFPGAPVRPIRRRTIVIDDPYDSNDRFKVTDIDSCYEGMTSGNNRSNTDLSDFLGRAI